MNTKVFDSKGEIRHSEILKIYNSKIILSEYITIKDTSYFPFFISDSLKYGLFKTKRGFDIYNVELDDRKVLLTDTFYLNKSKDILIFEGIVFGKNKNSSFKEKFKHIYKKNFGILESVYFVNDSIVSSKKYY